MQTIEELKKELLADPNGLISSHTIYAAKTMIDKAFALGTLNGLDKAEQETENARMSDDCVTKDYANGFVDARSQILSKINEAKEKLWN